MLHPNNGRSRVPQARRLVPGECQSCGRQFFYRRVGRPKEFCDQKCRQAVRQDGHQADFRRFVHSPSRIDESTPKSEVNSKTFGPDFAGRGSSWRVVAGPEPSSSGLRCATVGAEGVIEANNRVNAEFWRKHNAKAEAACLIKRHSPPVNLVSGYKFPDAPVVDLAPDAPVSLTSKQLQQLNDLRSQIPDDLSIPAFLRRTP